MNYNLIKGNSLEILKTLEANSVDSIVTDPPYELGFMGKSWDSTGIAFNKALWTEALRILKPGGHLIAFSGSRTYHRMACAIEDAGFQIRDQIMWVYGSGFPKSLDISKQIDKHNGENCFDKLFKFTEFMRITGLKASQLNKITNSNMGSHYLTDKKQPAIPTPEYWELIKPLIKIEIPKWVEEYVKHRKHESENMKKREVIGNKNISVLNYKPGENIDSVRVNLKITKAYTQEAKQWEGWGTALKPAHEPMVLARKPLSEEIVANNVLKHGVGGINIDACRVESDDWNKNKVLNKYTGSNKDNNSVTNNFGVKDIKFTNIESTLLGRWPANFIHDGLDTEWAKFFYCPKATKKDRNDGLDDFEEVITFNGAGIEGSKGVKTKNSHPTVKPTDLMSYLVKLITPPNGTVLDPFNGSGSTGKACALNGFNYIGIDLSQEYLDISKARIESALGKV